MNNVLLTGRLTRDPELRVLASGKNVTTYPDWRVPTAHVHARNRPLWTPKTGF